MSSATFDSVEKGIMREKVAKPLLGIGIFSIIMLFAGLTSAYVVRKSDGVWQDFEIPSVIYISTFIIILSSISLIWASISLKKNNIQGLIICVGLTLFLSIIFIFSQFELWFQLTKIGVFFSSPNAAGSFLIAFVFLHVAHLLGGVISLIIVFINSIRKKYSATNRLGFQLCEIYWHFLGGLWLYLLLFLKFIS